MPIAKSRAYQVGYADTLHGIRTFPANGTDKHRDVVEWADAMVKATQKCKDKDYSEGVLAALKDNDL